MKVSELIELLSEFYPDEDVVLYTFSHRVMQLLGINRQVSEQLGAIAIDCDWSMVEGTIVESEMDKIKRERDKLSRKIVEANKYQREKNGEQEGKPKRGRPRKYPHGTPKTGRRPGRPRKNPQDTK